MGASLERAVMETERWEEPGRELRSYRMVTPTSQSDQDDSAR
jgi:hypothetical protein